MSRRDHDDKVAPPKPPRPTEYAIHPYCELVPDTNEDDFAGLVASIQAVGVQESLILAKVGRTHQIIDGRTRQRAVLFLWDKGVYFTDGGKPIDLPCHFLPAGMSDRELLALVDSKSQRRNLNQAQKTCRALEFHAQDVKIAKDAGTPIKIEGDFATYISDRYGLNRRYVSHCHVLRTKARDLYDAVYKAVLPLKAAMSAYKVRTGTSAAATAAAPGSPAAAAGRTDGLGKPLPAALVPAFDDCDAFLVLSAEIRKMGDRIKTLSLAPGGGFLDPAPLVAQLGSVAAAVSKARPFTACPKCHGKKCDRCNKTGYVTKLMNTAAEAHKS